MAEQVKSNRRTETTTPLKNSTPNKIIKKEDDTPSFYICPSCGSHYKKLDGNFPASQSNIYGDTHKLPICRNCIDKLYQHYCIVLGDEDEAIRRICMKFDIYYDQSLANASRKITKDRSRIFTYISRANLTQYKDKTYDTTIDDETSFVIVSIDEAKDTKNIKQRTVKFFGFGFTEPEYKELQDQYDDWIARHECKTKAQEELFKNLCIAQLNIQKAQQTNGKVAEAMKAFQDLLGSANIKPAQTNDNTLTNQNAFGTLIKKWENEKPIPEPEDEWKDVDKIAKYITVYFLGHLCKMMGIKNSYARMYDQEMSKYKVDKPEYEDDDEALFDSVFGGDVDEQ